jgi:PAS domain S-box-containing protein
VTERKAIEVTRRKTEERFLALLESAPDPVVVIDDAGRIVLVNAQTERLFGYDRAELHNQPVEILLPDRFRDRHVRHRLGFLADPRTRPMGAGRELAGRRKNGTEFPVDISLSGIETSEGRLAAAFIRDVTNREARVELERSIAERRAVLDHVVTAGEEERQRIAADIHDDSIQVMTAVGMRLQILRRGLSDDEQLVRISELQETVRLAIGRLRHLLFALRPPALDNEGLAAALHLYVEELGKSASTSYRLDDRLVSQPSQATRVIIYRIAQEVLTNVVKHAQASRSTILLSEREGGYFVRIEDDGIGFDGSAARSRPGHLGLAAIQERAELADGWLKVESAPGAGTKVEFWLPPDREPQDHLPTVELQVR